MEFVMDDILIYTIIIGFAFWLGWHVRAIVIMANLATNPEKMIKMLEKIKEINEQEELGLPEDAIEVETEQVNGLVFAYNKTSGEFLAQAQNIHQVMVEAAKRYPGKKFWHPEMKKDHQTA
jgi:hypothetical protein